MSAIRDDMAQLEETAQAYQRELQSIRAVNEALKRETTDAKAAEARMRREAETVTQLQDQLRTEKDRYDWGATPRATKVQHLTHVGSVRSRSVIVPVTPMPSTRHTRIADFYLG